MITSLEQEGGAIAKREVLFIHVDDLRRTRWIQRELGNKGVDSRAQGRQLKLNACGLALLGALTVA